MKLDINIREKYFSIIRGRIELLKGKKIIIDENMIDTIIKTELQINGDDYDQEDYQFLVKEIEYNAQIKHTPSSVIYSNYDESEHNWYTNLDVKDGEFWRLYKRYLEQTNSIDRNSLNNLEQNTLPELMNCLGNPRTQGKGKQCRMGLVIGDVQSGKTSTYAGLICKAADAGYKVVILLTGITETLRQQTQERMDEGIIGYTVRYVQRGTKKVLQRDMVGVGKYEHKKTATAFTSYQFDFKKMTETISTSLKSHNSLVMFVVKKNVRILENLYKWLVELNQDVLDGLIHAPMLLIDDEADNASINTNDADSDPTKTNSVIRRICQAFANSNYVGFTATPFANVFIEPDSTKEMVGMDLFPKDFIYVLPTPSSYIGATKLFYPGEDLYKKCLKFITDIEEPSREELKDDPSVDERPLYYKHGKNWHGTLPKSLTEAIHCFYLANVIRDLRHDESKPRTMMINVSRFVKVHRHIVEYVKNLYDTEYKIIIADFNQDYQKNSGNDLWRQLKSAYEKHFSHCEFTIEEVLNKENLMKAIENILVVSVNSRKDSDKLDYSKENGPRYIAIGGLSLSRGLTLSGLMTSYFYRNTATFDVLMQMGRWFGYRPHYADICQIWTSFASADYYKDVSLSTEELKNDIRQMREEKLTPKEFGIKVHDISKELSITSANKMRHSFDHEELFVFWGNLFETPYVNTKVETNKINKEAVKDLISNLSSNRTISFVQEDKKNKGTILVPNVPRIYIDNFIRQIKVSMKNHKFYHKDMCDFLFETDDEKLDKWDIVFFSGNGSAILFNDELELKQMNRTLKVVGNHIGFTGSSGRLGSKSDGLYAIKNSNLINQAIEAYKKEKDLPMDKIISKSDCPSDTWFKYISDRNPCLMIYLVEPSDKTDREVKLLNKYLTNLKGDYILGFGVGFPQNGEGAKNAKKYKVNKVYQKQLIEEAGEDEDVIL